MKILLRMKGLNLIGVSFAFFWGVTRSEAGVLVNQPSQYPNSFNALTTQNQASGASFQSYDNFTLTGNSPVSILSVTWQGIYWNPQAGAPTNPISFNPLPTTIPPSYFGVGFYSNSNNLPGTLLNPLQQAIQLSNLSIADVGTAGFGPNSRGGFDTVNVYNFSADLDVTTTFQLNPGTYWFSVVWFAPNNSYPPVFLWTSGTGGDGKSAQLAYGQPNPVYATGDRAFSLSSDPAQDALTSTAPGNPPTGQLNDIPVPEPASLAVMGTLLGIVGVVVLAPWRYYGEMTRSASLRR